MNFWPSESYGNLRVSCLLKRRDIQIDSQAAFSRYHKRPFHQLKSCQKLTLDTLNI